MQVLAIKRKDTGEWALPGGMVKAGDSVSATVKKSINEVGNFKNPAKQKEFDELVKVLFAEGTEVYAGYNDDPRNTDNAWMESKAVHFHCTKELGEMLPLNLTNRGGKDVKGGQVGWLDANAEIEPRYAAMVRCVTRRLPLFDRTRQSALRCRALVMPGSPLTPPAVSLL